MLVSLVHGSMDWIMAGFIICLGLIVFLGKLVKGEIISFIIGGVIWAFVYKVHGGVSTASIMSATFAALLFDLVGLRVLGLMAGFKKR